MGKKNALFWNIYLINKAFIPMFFFIGYVDSLSIMKGNRFRLKLSIKDHTLKISIKKAGSFYIWKI